MSEGKIFCKLPTALLVDVINGIKHHAAIALRCIEDLKAADGIPDDVKQALMELSSDTNLMALIDGVDTHE